MLGYDIIPKVRGHGGIGRRAGFRIRFFVSAGSSPVARTKRQCRYPDCGIGAAFFKNKAELLLKKAEKSSCLFWNTS